MVIVVEGQIGAGKTTLATELAKYINTGLYLELQNPLTEQLLGRFYKDMERWAFTLQIHFLNERFQKIKQIFRDGGGVLDRSIYGDKIFADTLAADGYMSQGEHDIYTTLLENMLEHAQKPTLMVYLHCSPETAIERIKQRDRTFEAGIEREYLENLYKVYEKWYTNYDVSDKLRVDTEKYPLDNEENMGRVLDTIYYSLTRGGPY